jgi:hypothetical protein
LAANIDLELKDRAMSNNLADLDAHGVRSDGRAIFYLTTQELISKLIQMTWQKIFLILIVP